MRAMAGERKDEGSQENRDSHGEEKN